MDKTDIIDYANQHMVYLREGDYWPTPLSNMNDGKGVESVEQLTEMLELGTVYPNRAVAKTISDAVKKLLNRTALELFVFGQGQIVICQADDSRRFREQTRPEWSSNVTNS